MQRSVHDHRVEECVGIRGTGEVVLLCDLAEDEPLFARRIGHEAEALTVAASTMAAAVALAVAATSESRSMRADTIAPS